MQANQGDQLVLRPARPQDWTAIAAMLDEAGLPRDGAHDHLAHFLVGEQGAQGGAVVCAAGLEHYGEAALLRSVVVAPSARGLGYGDAMTAALLARAKARGARQLVLLTTTAADYFARRGFREMARDAAPPAMRSSREFQGACPASATVMTIAL